MRRRRRPQSDDDSSPHSTTKTIAGTGGWRTRLHTQTEGWSSCVSRVEGSTPGSVGELGVWELRQGAWWLEVDYRGRLRAKMRRKVRRASRRELEQEVGKHGAIGCEKRTRKNAMQHVDQRLFESRNRPGRAGDERTKLVFSCSMCFSQTQVAQQNCLLAFIADVLLAPKGAASKVLECWSSWRWDATCVG